MSNDSEDGVLANWQQGVLELEERPTTSRPLPLRMRAIPDWQLFWAQDPPFADAFLRELIAT